MEGRVLVINLDSFDEKVKKSLYHLFEYAFIEDLDVVVFSNGIMDKRDDVTSSLDKLTRFIPQLVDTTLFLGYKDSYRISSKAIEDVSRFGLNICLGNHVTTSVEDKDINFFNSDFNPGMVDEVLEKDTINVFTSSRESEVCKKSLKYGNSLIYVGSYSTEDGYTATELTLEHNDYGELIMKHSLVLDRGNGFEKKSSFDIELDRYKKKKTSKNSDFMYGEKEDKCLIKM